LEVLTPECLPTYGRACLPRLRSDQLQRAHRFVLVLHREEVLSLPAGTSQVIKAVQLGFTPRFVMTMLT